MTWHTYMTYIHDVMIADQCSIWSGAQARAGFQFTHEALWVVVLWGCLGLYSLSNCMVEGFRMAAFTWKGPKRLRCCCPGNNASFGSCLFYPEPLRVTMLYDWLRSFMSTPWKWRQVTNPPRQSASEGIDGPGPWPYVNHNHTLHLRPWGKAGLHDIAETMQTTY